MIGKDICPRCGTLTKRELWGAECPKCGEKSLHVYKCSYCDNLVGSVIDDDYCVPEKNMCNDCITRLTTGRVPMCKEGENAFVLADILDAALNKAEREGLKAEVIVTMFNCLAVDREQLEEAVDFAFSEWDI